MAKGGLGRGLSSLISNTETEVSGAAFEGNNAQGQVMEVPLAKIAPNPNQPRHDFAEETLNELADSIKKNGLIQPIVVRKHGIGYEIIAGERRYQASKRAGLEKIPVVVKEATDVEMFKLALIENIQRDDLNHIEQAKGYKKLIEMNGVKNISELAALVSKSQSNVANVIRLLKLPEKVQDMIADGSLSWTTARAILSVEGDEKRIAIAEKAVENDMTTSEVENYTRAIKEADEREAAKQDDPVNPPDDSEIPEFEEIPDDFIDKAIARMNSSMHSNKVKIKGKNGSYKVEIPISNEQELSDLLSFFPDVAQ